MVQNVAMSTFVKSSQVNSQLHFQWSFQVAATAFTGVALCMAAASHSPVLRSRLSAADSDPLYGPDVLSERLVVPPSIPDWIMMDCEKSDGAQSVLDQIQDSLCDKS